MPLASALSPDDGARSPAEERRRRALLGYPAGLLVALIVCAAVYANADTLSPVGLLWTGVFIGALAWFVGRLVEDFAADRTRAVRFGVVALGTSLAAAAAAADPLARQLALEAEASSNHQGLSFLQSQGEPTGAAVAVAFSIVAIAVLALNPFTWWWSSVRWGKQARISVLLTAVPAMLDMRRAKQEQGLLPGGARGSIKGGPVSVERCPACQARSYARRRPRRLLHAVLTMMTYRLWSIVWIALALHARSKPRACVACGYEASPTDADAAVLPVRSARGAGRFDHVSA